MCASPMRSSRPCSNDAARRACVPPPRGRRGEGRASQELEEDAALPGLAQLLAEPDALLGGLDRPHRSPARRERHSRARQAACRSVAPRRCIDRARLRDSSREAPPPSTACSRPTRPTTGTRSARATMSASPWRDRSPGASRTSARAQRSRSGTERRDRRRSTARVPRARPAAGVDSISAAKHAADVGDRALGRPSRPTGRCRSRRRARPQPDPRGRTRWPPTRWPARR